MEKEFCEKCHNLLEAQAANDKLTFRCVSCNSVRDADPLDTLRFEEVKGMGLDLFASIFETLAEDPVNPKVEKRCPNPKCKGRFAKFARLGEEMILVNACITCKTQWQGV